MADYISAVNDVIGVCRDAQEGFRGAANAVKDPQLKAIFERYSEQRAEFADELQSALLHTGADPARPSGVAGKLHASWMALKGALTGHSDHQILEETERGEDHSMNTYRDALASNLPDDLRVILERQFRHVQEGHAEMRTLRDSTGRAA